MQTIPRRAFLRQTTLYAFSVSALGCTICTEPDPGPEPPRTDCGTTADILGPYYRPGAPFRTNLVVPGHTAPALLVKGTVFGADCTTPLAGVLVEYWQSDSAGQYDNDSPDFRFRGQFRTGADGQYAFSTIVPGRYLNGNTYRPSHIHFRITAPGHRELVSQVYFKDDPYLAADPWASRPDAKLRILTLENGADGAQTVSFPIYLVKA
jgi:protocatechuate 3,4-dioxygenase beta subunit